MTRIRAATLDTVVRSTRDDGLCLVITIGNGGANNAIVGLPDYTGATNQPWGISAP